MSRYIGRKLDFLMTLTDTKNNALAKALNFDSSHISRIRRSERGLPHRRSFVDPAATYFARHIREPWQIKAAEETITAGEPWPTSEVKQAAMIAAWLTGEETEILSVSKSRSEDSPDVASSLPGRGRYYYYGRQGKRAAVERFLTQLIDLPEPTTLLLYSDEGMEWLAEDPDFALRWRGLLTAFLQKGGRIRIVHNLSRNIGEMLQAVQQWMPLYMEGTIEPWFCPRVRDGLFLQSRFIAKGIAAVVSTSVEGQRGQAGNIFIDNHEMVRALEKEFDALLAHCRPLMKSFRQDRSLEFFLEWARLEKEADDMISLRRLPSLATLPEETAAAMGARLGSNRLQEYASASAGRFRQLLESGHTATEILHLPDPETVRSGGAVFPMWDFFGSNPLHYRPEELAAHLTNTIRLLQQEEGYRVILTDAPGEGINLQVKGATGALVYPSAPPGTAFVISEQTLTASIYEYLRRTIKTSDRAETIRRLEEYIKALTA